MEGRVLVTVVLCGTTGGGAVVRQFYVPSTENTCTIAALIEHIATLPPVTSAGVSEAYYDHLCGDSLRDVFSNCSESALHSGTILYEETIGGEASFRIDDPRTRVAPPPLPTDDDGCRLQ